MFDRISKLTHHHTEHDVRRLTDRFRSPRPRRQWHLRKTGLHAYRTFVLFFSFGAFRFRGAAFATISPVLFRVAMRPTLSETWKATSARRWVSLGVLTGSTVMPDNTTGLR